MPKDDLCTENDIDLLRMFLISVFILKIALKLYNFLLGSGFESIPLFLLDTLIEKQLVVEIEVAFRHDLEQRFAIKVDVGVLLVGLVVDVWVRETKSPAMYPLDMMRPLHSFPAIVLTPWIRMMSPHLIVYCSYDIQDIS